MGRSRGLFITLDGPSGVGKTTVGNLLGERLKRKGHSVLITSTPSPSPIGQLARRSTYALRGTALTCLVAADRYSHVETTVDPALKRGAVVIWDRYVPSSLVLDGLDGMPPEFVWEIYQQIAVPDISYILLADPIVCASRTKQRGRYSRFHPRSKDDSRREIEMFIQAFTFLQRRGYPVHSYSIGMDSDERVADELTAAILQKIRGE